jgi:hypothetical protein
MKRGREFTVLLSGSDIQMVALPSVGWQAGRRRIRCVSIIAWRDLLSALGEGAWAGQLLSTEWRREKGNAGTQFAQQPSSRAVERWL